MNYKTWHVFTLILCLALYCSSCAAPSTNVPTSISPTNTTRPESTSFEPSSKDAVLISFIRAASDGMDDMSACLNGHNIYRFVLYGNGRLIRFDTGQYLETNLSQAEMDDLLAELEATGFSSLAGDGDQYVQNAPPPSFKDPWGGSITVQEKRITITPGQSDYLAEPVTRTLEIIENYRPGNLQLYAPESVSLWTFTEDSISLGTANPTPEPPVLNWSVDAINLDDVLTDTATSKPQIVTGDTLSFLMQDLKHTPAVRRVEQNGQNYLIVLCPNFR